MLKREQLQGIYEFIAVVEEGSFSNAAQAMGTTRSRVSQIITSLERRIGIQLLNRSTRSMQLTEAGKYFYEQCRQGLQLIHVAIEQMEEDQTEITGKIRLNSVGGLFGDKILAPVILRFMAQNPNITVELDFSSTRVDLIEEQYDLAIRMGDLPDSTLIARPLTAYGSHTCCTPTYLEMHGKPQHPKDLLKHKTVVGSMNRWRYYRKEGDLDDFIDVSVKGSLICRNGYVVRDAALAHQGIARLPDYYIGKDIEEGRLIPLFPEWWCGLSQVSIVYPQARFRMRRVQMLIDFLLREFTD